MIHLLNGLPAQGWFEYFSDRCQRDLINDVNFFGYPCSFPDFSFQIFHDLRFGQVGTFLELYIGYRDLTGMRIRATDGSADTATNDAVEVQYVEAVRVETPFEITEDQAVRLAADQGNGACKRIAITRFVPLMEHASAEPVQRTDGVELRVTMDGAVQAQPIPLDTSKATEQEEGTIVVPGEDGK